MEPTEFSKQTETKLKRIAWLSGKDSNKVFDNLMHHFNEESLKDCFHSLDGRKAVGTDGITKSNYEEALAENLQGLIMRLKRMAYRPEPVREVLIPKEDKPDAKRALGISNFEDKLVQKMMQKVLESIYEPLFLECSYGFRPGRGCHDAIRALSQYLYKHEVEMVIDVDISNFFGTVDHKELDKILRKKIKDERFMRYIHRLFKAGILRNNELQVDEAGVPQGTVCSPILSNIYAHYVIDCWFEEVAKKHCAGEVALYRYCDDMVICCQYQKDAKRIKRALVNRLGKYHLHLNEEKTRCVPFSRKQQNRGVKQGTFDFLGFTFYLGKSKSGGIVQKVKTSKKRLRSKIKGLTAWIKSIRNHQSLKPIWELFCAKLRGHYQYYGVSYNLDHLKQFLHKSLRIMFKWLNRRSQRRSFTWEKFQLFIAGHPLPPMKICHKLF
jgi:RNA-directed DNA polymerase